MWILLGYRRYGHNEMDEPLVTNPVMYNKIHEHQTVRELYGAKLASANIVKEEDVAKLDAEIFATMQAANDRVKEQSTQAELISNATPEEVLAGYPRDLATGVDETTLRRINEELLDYPEGFNVFGKLQRILKRRKSRSKAKVKLLGTCRRHWRSGQYCKMEIRSA